MSSLPQTYQAVVVSQSGGDYELKTKTMKQPGPREILVKVLACGVCHTDDILRNGSSGAFPLVLGHEIVGDVVAVGEGVSTFSVGSRVGGTFHGGRDGTCRSCQRGLYQYCDNHKITGVASEGGFAEYTILREEVAVHVPKEADPAEMAPLMCAGVTVFVGIRQLQVGQGNLVAVHGLGGLGHMAVQFASKMGYEVVAISRGEDKRELAMSLGAHHYIDTAKEDAAEALMAKGGAAVIIATAPVPEAVSPLIMGLQAGGKLLMLAAPGPVPFNTGRMVFRGLSIHSSLIGTALDVEETVKFALRNDIKCLVECFPLADVKAAVDAMLSSKVRFRAVLTM